MIPADLPECQRQELHEELLRGRRPNPRIGQAVERLTTPRVSARSASLRTSASERRLSTLPERAPVSPNFPYPAMRPEGAAATGNMQSSGFEGSSEPSLSTHALDNRSIAEN